MKIYAILIIILLFVTIFVHYYNRYGILQNNRNNERLSKQLAKLERINKKLSAENSYLSSRDYIETLARNKLDMFYPEDDEHVHNIGYNEDDNSFKLIDYIVPSVEALTNE